MHTKYSMNQSEQDLVHDYFKNHSLNPRILPFFSMVYDYFRNAGHAFPLDLAKKICESMTKDEYKFIITSYNHTDGMGDCIGHLYLTQRFHALFSGLTNIKTKNIFFIAGEQMPAARGIMQSKMPGFSYSTISKEKFDINLMENPLLLIEFDPKNGNINKDFKPLLASEINTSNLTLNISTPFYKIMEMSKNNTQSNIDSAYIMSWLEYGGRTDSIALQPIKDLCMGIRDEHLGLRIFNDIGNSVNTSRADRAKLLESIQNKDLLKKLLGLENPSAQDLMNFLENNHLGFAYFGNRDNAKFCGHLFSLLSAGVPDKGNVCIIINPAWVSALQDNAIWKENLANMGYTRLEFFDDKGELTRIPLVNKPGQERVLKMIPLAGIQHEDKIKLIAAAAFHGSAGDTSKSEMISSGCSGDFDAALPFIQPISFQNEFDNDLLQAIVNCNKRPEWKEESRALREYLDILINKMDSLDNEAMLNLIAFVKKNKSTIVSSWKQFCHFVASEKNVEKSLQEQLIFMNFMNKIKKGKANDYVDLMIQMQQSSLLHQNLIALPLILNEYQVFYAVFSEITKGEFQDFARHHIDETLINTIIHNTLEQPGFALQIPLLQEVTLYSQKRGFNSGQQLLKIFEKYIRDNDSDSIQKLLLWVKNTGISIKPYQMTLLDSAIREKRVAILKLFLSESEVTVNSDQMLAVAASNNFEMVQTFFDYAKMQDIKPDFPGFSLQAIKNHKHYADNMEHGTERIASNERIACEKAIAKYFLANIDAIQADVGNALLMAAIDNGSPDLIQTVLHNANIRKAVDESLLRASLAQAVREGKSWLVTILFNHMKFANIRIDYFELALEASAAKRQDVFQFFMEAVEKAGMIKADNISLLIPLIQSVLEQNNKTLLKSVFKKLKNNGIHLFNTAESLEHLISHQIKENRAKSVAFLCDYARKNSIDLPFARLATQALMHDHDAVLYPILHASVNNGILIDNLTFDNSTKPLLAAAIENNKLRCLPVLLALGADSSVLSCTSLLHASNASEDELGIVKKIIGYQCDFLIANIHEINNQMQQFNESMPEGKYSDDKLEKINGLTEYLTDCLIKAKLEIISEQHSVKNWIELINKSQSEIDLLIKDMLDCDKMDLIMNMLRVPEKNLDQIFYLYDREEATFLKIFSNFSDFEAIKNLLQEREKHFARTNASEKNPHKARLESTTSMLHVLNANPANIPENTPENGHPVASTEQHMIGVGDGDADPENKPADKGLQPGTFK